MGRYYTLGIWRVKEGQESGFIAAWKALGEVFYQLPCPPGPGTLLQSESDPHMFYSFGPWDRLEDIDAMRDDPRAQGAIALLIELCDEASAGAFRVVAEAGPEG